MVVAVCALAACGRIGFDASGTGDGGTGDGRSGDGGGGPDAPRMITEGPVAIPGGAFNRENNQFFPATVSSFSLDRYEVTVRRFRPFVEGGFGVQTKPPAAGGGLHPLIAGTGWDPAWSALLSANTTTFRTKLISTLRSTYSPIAGVRDEMPIVDVSWFEAFAFCVWDGGRLPTYAEYQLALLGGAEQRVYPWSVPPTSTTFGPAQLSAIQTELVGSHPAGDGRWTHADLVGNVDEWVLDEENLPLPCTNCASLGDSTSPRFLAGWDWGQSPTDYANGGSEHGASPSSGSDRRGFRCAR